MPLNPEMRVSDTDRDRVAAELREHTAQGRITMDELQDRLESTYAAKTVGELQRVTADLPEQDLYELPVPAARRSSMAGTPLPVIRPRGALYKKGLAVAWASWASVNLVCMVTWLLSVVVSGSWIYPWPIWVAGPWGAVILGGTVFGRMMRR